MAILNRDDFFSRIQTVIGDDTSDDAMSFVEDMTDTYNEMESRANESGEDWERRYHELDESWKKKYKHRFFSGNGRSNPGNEPEVDPDGTDNRGETITINDLFK